MQILVEKWFLISNSAKFVFKWLFIQYDNKLYTPPSCANTYMLFNYYKSNAWMVLWWLTLKSTLYWFHANINLKYRYKTPFFLKSFPSTNNNNCYYLVYWFCKFLYQWNPLSFIVYFAIRILFSIRIDNMVYILAEILPS